jgi:hypothetical protein
MPENLNQSVTRADLNQQLEIYAKTVELQLLLSQQQEDIIKKLSELSSELNNINQKTEVLERRTWKQGWLFWGIIFSLISTIGTVLVKGTI